MADAPLAMERPWRLALVVKDQNALRVAAAYYALPKKQRADLELIAGLANVSIGIAPILTRLRTAGLMDGDDPPPILEKLLNKYVREALE